MEQPLSPLGDYRPLKGLKAVELASVLAGPLVGTFLSELGAEVTKVEHPGTAGDVTRQWRAAGESNEGISAYYAAANGPKNVVMLDLTQKEDQLSLDHLLGEADFLLQNFKASSLPLMGLEPAILAARFPRLIHLHLQGFLCESNRPGYDMVVQAETGLMGMNGEPGHSPFRMPVAMMDILAAHQMRSAAMLALWEREKDGQGSYSEIWLDAAGLSALVNRGTEFLVAGSDPKPLGAAHPQIAPYGESFVCSCGGKVVLAIGNDRQFKSLCEVLGLDHLADEKRFATNPMRVKHRAALAESLTDALRHIEREVLMQLGRDRGIPLGRVNRVSEALDSPAGRAMTAPFELEGQSVRHLRQVAFRIQRNGNLMT